MKKAGFTLLEVVIAILIMAGGIILLYSSAGGTQSRIRKARVFNNVALLLERKVAEIEAKNRGKTLTEISDEEGDFGGDYSDYRWSFAVQPFEMPDMSPLLTRDGASQDMLMVLSQLREVMNQNILEGTVTVYVKSREKEIPFSVTTYFIDWEKEVQLPGFGGGGP